MLEATMVTRVVRVAKALADPNRVQILALLREGRESSQLPCCGLAQPVEQRAICNCELQEILRIPQSNVSYHIKALREAGLVRELPVGKWSYVAIDPAAYALVDAFLGRSNVEGE